MLSKTFFTLAGLIAAVTAVTVTKPELGAKLDFSQTNEIAWTFVDTDTPALSIVLIDNSAQPPASVVIADSVNTKDGKYTFTNFVAKVGNNYQINLLSKDTLNTGILAQSQKFEITKSGVAPTTSRATNPTQTGNSGASSTSSSFAMPTNAGVVFGVAPVLAAAALIL